MKVRSTEREKHAGPEPADGGSTSLVPAASRRTIRVGDAKTIVVHPRIPTSYKAMIWFSFGLNVLLLLLLLVGGAYAYNLYASARHQLHAVASELNLQTPTGKRVAALASDPIRVLRNDPTPAIDTARSNVDQLMTSIEGLESAHIRTSIPIDKSLPIDLQVPVNQETAVRTTAPVPLVAPATFTFPGGGGQINGSVALSLPAGMELPVNLNMTIPISSSVPVKLDVPVDIPLQNTDLSDDLNRLHELVEPAARLVKARP